MNQSKKLSIAFAAAWKDDRSKTWSGTPLSLESALQRRADIECIDTPIQVNKYLEDAARIAYVRRVGKNWVSQYRISPVVTWSSERGLHKALSGVEADIALVIGDHGVPPLPFMTYFDHTLIHNEAEVRNGETIIDRLAVHTPRLLRWRTQKQIDNFSKASALISMSNWEADALKASGLVDNQRVFVVPPGRNAVGNRATFEEKKENRLLFVGRDFIAKGGDQVVRSFVRLRESVNYDVTLVIAGPKTWPLAGPIPNGVEFLGEISYTQVHNEMRRACAFIMPSVYEAYGIVFLEALGEGLPVIGRNVCAMPEFITHGVNGFMLEPDDSGDVQLAEYMHLLCTDHAMRKRVHAAAEQLHYQISWERAADDMIRIARWCVENPPNADGRPHLSNVQ